MKQVVVEAGEYRLFTKKSSMGGLWMSKKVLIVDDQNGIRILLMEVFSNEGYQTFQASNGKLALEIVKAHTPDLVLLDMKIPGMDGLDILKHIKSMNPEIKVIMMTAYGELDMIKEATELGALMHFTKPFDIDELRMAVNAQLRGGITSGMAMGS
jgi:two-component system response regulator (stage 0 sporulation protein F)